MDLNCPYCDEELDINHDDGFGWEENEKHQMQCKYCKKYFVFSTQISIYYYAKKAECLNNGNHKWKLTATFPRELSQMFCTKCDERRALTESERVKYKIGTRQSYIDSLITNP
jgi:hypothetical protein